MMPDNHDAFAVITGGASGLGAEYGRQLAARGFAILIVDRDGEKAGSLAKALWEEFGTAAEFLQADLTSRAELDRVAEAIAGRKVAYLINAAGFGTATNLVESSIEVQLRMIELDP